MATTIKFSKTGDVGAMIARDVAQEIANAKGTLAVFKGYIGLCAAGKMLPDHARPLLLARNEALKAARIKAHDSRPVAPLQDSRVSEMRSILRMHEWKCYPVVLGYLDGMDVDRGVLLTVSKFLRKAVKGEMKKSADAAPSREAVMRAIKARKAQKRGSGNATSSKVATVRNPETSLSVIKRQAKGMAKWFGKDGGAQFMAAIIKACESALPVAKKVAKQREAAAAAA